MGAAPDGFTHVLKGGPSAHNPVLAQHEQGSKTIVERALNSGP